MRIATKSDSVPDNVTSYSSVDLVFYGIDTVADVQLNGLRLGQTDNMFVRYKYNVKTILKVYIYQPESLGRVKPTFPC